MSDHNLITNMGNSNDRTDLPESTAQLVLPDRLTWPIARLDSEKHSAVCRNCDEGYRPVNPVHWTGPRPCPLCQYSNKEEDSALLESYKVRPGLSFSGGSVGTISSQYSPGSQWRAMLTSIQCARIQWRRWMRSTATGRVINTGLINTAPFLHHRETRESSFDVNCKYFSTWPRFAIKVSFLLGEEPGFHVHSIDCIGCIALPANTELYIMQRFC